MEPELSSYCSNLSSLVRPVLTTNKKYRRIICVIAGPPCNACLIPISPKSITQWSTRKQTHWVAIRIDEATQNAGWRIEFAFMSPHRAVVHDPRTYESPNRNTKGF